MKAELSLPSALAGAFNEKAHVKLLELSAILFSVLRDFVIDRPGRDTQNHGVYVTYYDGNRS